MDRLPILRGADAADDVPEEAPRISRGSLGGNAPLKLFSGEERYTAVCRLYLREAVLYSEGIRFKTEICDDITRDRFLQRCVKLAFYRAALSSGLEKPVWGALTGIRPGVLLSKLLEEGISEGEALEKFRRDNDVSAERARLCLHTARASLECQKSLEPRDICLYVGIPFCPTRCAYCSFVSQSVQKSMKLIPEYLKALYREIEATAKAINELGLRAVAVYMGGGTPTTLSAEELDELCGRLEESFDFSSVREYTVEAGRPDTITAQKLEVLKRHGVSRVSVNPQTMEDRVLEAIGRHHTAQDVLDALEIVRAVGGFQVNMDLIAGLPMDTPETFKSTLEKVLSLSPENITVHTLALKKGSAIMLGDRQTHGRAGGADAGLRKRRAVFCGL